MFLLETKSFGFRVRQVFGVTCVMASADVYG